MCGKRAIVGRTGRVGEVERLRDQRARMLAEEASEHENGETEIFTRKHKAWASTPDQNRHETGKKSNQIQEDVSK